MPSKFFLAELERELGSPLFDRHARGMALTVAGRAFVQRATAILHEVRRARDEVDQLDGGTQGSVAVALSIAAHLALLPGAISPFRSRFPAVQLRVIEGIYPTLEAGLREGSIDFYIGPAPATPCRRTCGRRRCSTTPALCSDATAIRLRPPRAWPVWRARNGPPPP